MTKVGATIEVRGATEHNLKNVDVEIDRGQITVITGVSGSGKSSLAFDTILAEAQRRFFHTLSHYSRQFLDLQSRPAARGVHGLSPAVSLAQNETPPSRKATVGTLCDVSELLGVMFARFGERSCPRHGLPTTAVNPESIAESLVAEHEGETLAICAPVAQQKKGFFKKQLTSFAEKGYVRAFIDGELVPLSPLPELAREEKHTIKIIIDHVKIKPKAKVRLTRSIETAVTDGGGYGEFYATDEKGVPQLDQGGTFSSEAGCARCGYSWPHLDSRHFSVNSLGKCPDCAGLGYDWDSFVAEADDDETEDVGIRERAGLIDSCGSCEGTGLSRDLQAITLGGKTPLELHQMPIKELRAFLGDLARAPLGQNPAFRRVCDEATNGLDRILDVGLPYLTMSRRIRSLSGGEAQRLKLAGILSENLRGVLYILDEPSQGLHPSEIEQVWKTLEALKRGGNTIVIVDHDETMIRKADWIVDLGPGGGAEGGRLLAKFSPQNAARFGKQSLTARHLLEHETSSAWKEGAAREETGAVRITGAHLHNLDVSEVSFPKSALTVVTGVSGAGKSSLVLSTLYPNLMDALHRIKEGKRRRKQGRHCEGFHVDEPLVGISLIDRKPIAKSSVSIPATYLDVLTDLRNLYAGLPEAQIAGLTARSFSLSVEGGRCPECKGRGEISLQMKFLADARHRCPVCQGKRYRPNVLDVTYAGKSMAEVLELTLDEASEHFKHQKRIAGRLKTAVELGLGYLKLGQPSASLSGGEAQRLKLVPYLNKKHSEGHVLILDEPTTGLHFEDVQRLLGVLSRLTGEGATVVVIEHSKEVITAADWVIDLGPGAASEGGRVVYQGPPMGLPKVRDSVTARYLT